MYSLILYYYIKKCQYVVYRVMDTCESSRNKLNVNLYIYKQGSFLYKLVVHTNPTTRSTIPIILIEVEGFHTKREFFQDLITPYFV